jgi:hypothetical protein
MTPVAADFGPATVLFQGRNDAASETSRSPALYITLWHPKTKLLVPLLCRELWSIKASGMDWSNIGETGGSFLKGNMGNVGIPQILLSEWLRPSQAHRTTSLKIYAAYLHS